MTQIALQIREEFGTLKRYAKIRNINYGTLRLVISRQKKVPYTEKILKKDGFLKYSKKGTLSE